LTWVILRVNLGSQDNGKKTFNKQEMLILYKLLVRERKLAKKVVILNKKANCKNFLHEES